MRFIRGGLQVLDGMFNDKKVSAGGSAPVTVIQQIGDTSNLATNDVVFASNVTSGNIIIAVGMLYSVLDETINAGDLTKSAGTATVGAVTLQIVNEYIIGGTDRIYVAIWSCQVTGTGSCTMTFSGGSTIGGSNLALVEAHCDDGAIAFDSGQTNSSQNTTGAPDSGSVTTTRRGIIVGGATFAAGGATTITPDGAFTQIYEEENGSINLVSSAIRRIVSGSTADSASWTSPTNEQWCAAVAAYVAPA